MENGEHDIENQTITRKLRKCIFQKFEVELKQLFKEYKNYPDPTDNPQCSSDYPERIITLIRSGSDRIG